MVEFLLKYAAYEKLLWDHATAALKGPHPFDPDSLIQYASRPNGATNDGTHIFLDPSLDPTEMAIAVTHESIEVYFEQDAGVNAKTLPMDYIADLIAGQVGYDIGQVTGDSGGLTAAWIDTVADGHDYNFWVNDQSPGAGHDYHNIAHENGESGTEGIGPWGIGQQTDHNFLGNPMGLSVDMLNWEGK